MLSPISLCCQEDPEKALMFTGIYSVIIFEVRISEALSASCSLSCSPPAPQVPELTREIWMLWEEIHTWGGKAFLAICWNPQHHSWIESPSEGFFQAQPKSWARCHNPYMKGLCKGSESVMIRFPSSQNNLQTSKETHHPLARARTRFSEVQQCLAPESQGQCLQRAMKSSLLPGRFNKLRWQCPSAIDHKAGALGTKLEQMCSELL